MGKNWKAPKLVVWTYTAQSYHCNISMILWSPTLLPNGDHIMKCCQILKHLSCVCLNINLNKDTSNSLNHNYHTHTHMYISYRHAHLHTSTHIHLSHKVHVITAPSKSILYNSTRFSYTRLCVGNCQTSANSDVTISCRRAVSIYSSNISPTRWPPSGQSWNIQIPWCSFVTWPLLGWTCPV